MAYEWCATCGNIAQYCRCEPIESEKDRAGYEASRIFWATLIVTAEASGPLMVLPAILPERRTKTRFTHDFAKADAKIGDCWKLTHRLVTECGSPEAGQNSADRSGPILT